MASNSLIPDQFDTDKEFERYCYSDIGDMLTTDLLDELHGIRCQMWGLKSERTARRIGVFEQARRIKWLRGRVLKIEAELRKRRYGTWDARRPEPKLAEGVTL